MATADVTPGRSEAARLALSAWAIEKQLRGRPDSERGRVMALRIQRRLLATLEQERHVPPEKRSFLEISDGSPAAVLLLHGATGSPADLRPLADHLHAGGLTVMGQRLPGAAAAFGDPPRVRWRADLQQATQVYDMLERLHQRVYIVGLSFGAALALHLGRRRQPAALALLAPALVPRVSVFVRLLLRLKIHHLGWVRRRAGWNLELLDAMEKARGRVGRVKAPIYAAQCEDDATISPASLRLLQRRSRHRAGRFRLFASGGHAILRAHGESVLNAEILEFFRRG